MVTFPNAKINIGLNIVERRTDGYHNIETVFYPLQLCDILEVIDGSEAYSLHTSGIPIEGDVKDNLITKAYQLLKHDFNIPPIDVFFKKLIPFGAGLGGGSADAAFMLKMLNEKFELNLSVTELEKYAAEVGADCAFFIQNKPVFASGIGNIFENIELNLKNHYIVIVKPDIHVSTAVAYAGVKPQKPENSLINCIQQPIHEWKHYIKNDFEKTVFKAFPGIEKIKNELYSQGALYASMSGSGSSVFGIFDKEVDLQPYFVDCFVWNEKI